MQRVATLACRLFVEIYLEVTENTLKKIQSHNVLKNDRYEYKTEKIYVKRERYGIFYQVDGGKKAKSMKRTSTLLNSRVEERQEILQNNSTHDI